MRIFFCLSCILFFCAFFSPNQHLKGQNDLVEITPITNYEFEIKNVSDYPIEVHIGDKINYRLMPQAWKRLDKKEIDKNSVLQLKYTQTDAVSVMNDIIRQMSEQKGLEWSRSVIRDFWGKLQNKEEVYLIEIARSYSEDAVLETWFEEELQIVEQDLRTNSDLLAASNGETNRFSPNFEPIALYTFTVSKERMTPLVNVIWDFPFKKQGLGDFWDRKSSNTTGELQISMGLPYEMRWGKSQTFSTVHGFFSIYRPAYGLLPEDDFFFVGDSYVKDSPSEVVELITADFINLNVNHLSGGLFFRTFFYPSFFVDIGGGYHFSHSARVHFDPTDEGGNPVPHLPDGLVFEKRKTKNIADLEMKKMYGLLRLGWFVTTPGYKEPAKGFYIVGSVRTISNPSLLSNDRYEFYFLDGNNELQEVPLTDFPVEENDSMKLLWKIGVGLGL